jgi:hypothetical protein
MLLWSPLTGCLTARSICKSQRKRNDSPHSFLVSPCNGIDTKVVASLRTASAGRKLYNKSQQVAIQAHTPGRITFSHDVLDELLYGSKVNVLPTDPNMSPPRLKKPVDSSAQRSPSSSPLCWSPQMMHHGPNSESGPGGCWPAAALLARQSASLKPSFSPSSQPWLEDRQLQLQHSTTTLACTKESSPIGLNLPFKHSNPSSSPGTMRVRGRIRIASQGERAGPRLDEC